MLFSIKEIFSSVFKKMGHLNMNVVLFGDVLAGRDRPAVEIHSTSPRVTFTPPPLLFFCVLFFQFSVQQTAFPLIVPHVWMHSHPVQLRSPEIEVEGG